MDHGPRLTLDPVPARARYVAWRLAMHFHPGPRMERFLCHAYANRTVGNVRRRAYSRRCKADGPWSALAVRGPLDLNLSGVLARLATPLANAGISIFAVSTTDTDYVLVRHHDMDRAVRVLRAAGHNISEDAEASRRPL